MSIRPSSDIDFPAYTDCCTDIVNTPRHFSLFKRWMAYRNFVNDPTFLQGIDYLMYLKQQSPTFLTDYLSAFQACDLVGTPMIYKYDMGRISASTLRYMKFVSDMTILFTSGTASLTGANIVEIGGGYGGLCEVMSQVYSFANYTIVDLPEDLSLIQEYLTAKGVGSVSYAAYGTTVQGPFDLVISTYAYDLCYTATQAIYDAQILSQSTQGFLVCNYGPEKEGRKEASLQSLTSYGIAYQEISESPSMNDGNYELIWGNINPISNLYRPDI